MPMRKISWFMAIMGYLLIMILELLHVASCPWLKNTTFSKSQTFISFCFYVYRVGNLPLGRQRSLCSWRWNSFETTKNPGTVNPFNIFQHLSTSVTQRVTQGLVEFATPAAVSSSMITDLGMAMQWISVHLGARRREPSQISLAR